MESVPFRQIAIFTILQFVYLLLCFGVTWIPIAGILFPLPFFLLIIIRQHILPKFFHPLHLWELDAAEYEEIAGVPHHYNRNLSFRVWNYSKNVRSLGTSEQQGYKVYSYASNMTIYLVCRNVRHPNRAVIMATMKCAMLKYWMSSPPAEGNLN